MSKAPQLFGTAIILLGAGGLYLYKVGYNDALRDAPKGDQSDGVAIQKLEKEIEVVKEAVAEIVVAPVETAEVPAEIVKPIEVKEVIELPVQEVKIQEPEIIMPEQSTPPIEEIEHYYEKPSSISRVFLICALSGFAIMSYMLYKRHWRTR